MESINKVQQIEFDIDYNKYSQFAVANWLLNRKKFVYNNDVAVTANGITIDTIGCETVEEVISKNKEAFERIGIAPFDIQKITTDGSEYNLIMIDNIGTVSTLDCDNIIDFESKNIDVLNKLSDEVRNEVMENVKELMGIREFSLVEDGDEALMNVTELMGNTEEDLSLIEVDDTDKITIIFQKLMRAKKSQNKDVKCVQNDIVYSTVDCNNMMDIYIKYSNEYFNYFEQEKDRLFSIPGMQETINEFKRTDNINSNYDDVNREYEQVFDTFNSIDFSNAELVQNWIENLVPYVNNPNVTISSRNIVELLKEKGYTEDFIEVNNINDFYKRVIAFEINDLLNYGFFATEYAYDNEINLANMQTTFEDTDILAELEEKRIEIDKCLFLVKKYITGEYDFGSNQMQDSFDTRIGKLRVKIVELEKQPLSNEPLDINIEFSKAVRKLEEVTYKAGRFSTEEEMEAMKLYYSAAAFPSTDNIIKALEKASKLTLSNEVREPLIDTLIKMDARYAATKDEDDVVAMKNTMDSLQIKPFTANSVNSDNEIQALTKEIEEIEKERNERIFSEEKVIVDLNKQLLEIDTKINNVKNNRNVKPQAEEDLASIIAPANDKSEEEIKKDKYKETLHQVAQGEKIFSDESRISEKDSWMEQKTAKYLNKINNNEDFTQQEETKKDLLELPHPIKTIKKASAKLLNKIHSIDFAKKIKEVLETLQQHRIATTVALATALLGSVGIMSAGLNSVEAQTINNIPPKETESPKLDDMVSEQPSVEQEVVVNQPVEEEKTFEEDLQNTLNQVIGGDEKVYISADRAANDIDGKQATNIDGSWINSTPGAYYQMDEEKLEKITPEQAQENWANGEQVIARMDNEQGTAGYVTIGQEDNTSNKTR